MHVRTCVCVCVCVCVCAYAYASRVYSKEESNVLYALCKMFSESHVPGIQTLTNENARFKYLIVGMALGASRQECDIERKCQKNTIQNKSRIKS